MSMRMAGAILVAILVFAAEAATTPQVPSDAMRYQRDLTRNARSVWGLDAPVATFAAQIHQESRWRASARSSVGAQGIAQFMPATATWISGVYPELADNHPDNPAWAMRAMVSYDRWLWERVKAADNCSRMAMTLSSYNGGLGWIARDQKRAVAQGLQPLVWFGQVEQVNSGRAPAMFAENRGYPRAILLKWQPVYGLWGGRVECSH